MITAVESWNNDYLQVVALVLNSREPQATAHAYSFAMVKEALRYDLPFCRTRVGHTLASLCIAPMHAHM